MGAGSSMDKEKAPESWKAGAKNNHLITVQNNTNNQKNSNIHTNTNIQNKTQVPTPAIKISLPDDLEHDTILSPDYTPRRLPTTRSSIPEDGISIESLSTEQEDIENILPGCAPFRPPSLTRKDLIPDLKMFSIIDNISISAPKLTSRTPEDLSYHLSKPAKCDLEKIRAFYIWITHNISYDTGSFFSGKIPKREGWQVLETGMGVCDHYSQLFLELCRAAEIPCMKMNGFAKGYGYTPDEPFKMKGKTSHSWNLVQVDNEWWPVDCTWGSGHVASNKKFEPFYQEFYFLPEPKHFILSHFPKKYASIKMNQTFQLLSDPVTIDDFNKRAKVEPGALLHGIKLSHKNYYFKAMRECDITLRAPVDIVKNVACHLREKKSKKCFDTFVLCEKLDMETYNIHIRLPAEYRFILEIYALPMTAKTLSFDLVTEYCIRCDEVCTDVNPYPKRFGVWGACPESIEYGFMEDIFKHTSYESKDGTLDLSLNLCNEVITLMQLRSTESARDMEEYVFCSYTASAMKISARLPKAGYYELNLFAQRPGEYNGRFDCIGHFLLHCSKGLEKCDPFPMYYPGAAEYNCMLLEPLQRVLPANKEIKFRLTSSTLKEVSIELEPMEKSGSNTWTGSIMTCDMEPIIRIYGTDNIGVTHQCLYEFKVES